CSPSTVLCSPSTVLCSPSTVLCSPSTVLCSPSTVLCSPRTQGRFTPCVLASSISKQQKNRCRKTSSSTSVSIIHQNHYPIHNQSSLGTNSKISPVSITSIKRISQR